MDDPIEACAKAIENWTRGNASLESFAWACSYDLSQTQKRLEDVDAENVDLQATVAEQAEAITALEKEKDALLVALNKLKQDREVEL